mgnify:CR=1 FL=1
MSKLFSDFSSFGPSLAESTHTQSISTNSIDSKSLQGSSSPDSDTDRDTQQRHRLRVPFFMTSEDIDSSGERNHQDGEAPGASAEGGAAVRTGQQHPNSSVL